MFYVGLDLGQRQDHTAMAVAQREERPFRLGVRLVERVPLGTPYPEVVERVREVTQHQALRGRCSLIVDGTGVGAPVVDMLRGAGLGCEICAVTITGGETAHASGSAGGVSRWSVPKKDLIAGVQVLLEKGELKIARRLKEAGSLVRELLDIEMHGKKNGRVRLGAEGFGEHDDLAIALALACWRGARGRRGSGVLGGEGRLLG